MRAATTMSALTEPLLQRHAENSALEGKTDGLASRLYREICCWESSEAQHLRGLIYLPVVAAGLTAAIFTGRTGVGIAAVGGAVSVGFGASQRFTRLRCAPMLLAAVAMAFSAWVGATIARENLLNTVAVLGIWGYALGAATALGPAVWWVCLQAVIALLISYAYPVGAQAAVERVVVVLVGGLVQTAVVMAVWRLRGEPLLDKSPPALPRLRIASMFHALSAHDSRGRYAARVGVVLALAGAVAHMANLPNGYWIPMTAAIVVKPDLHATLARGIARMAGTIAGAALATGFLSVVRPTPPILGVLLVFAVWACYTVQRVNYVAFAASLTTYVVLLLALLGLPGPTVAVNRLVATLLGGCLALFAHAAAVRVDQSVRQNLN